MHPHSFRHERAYKLLRSGKFSESDVRDMLGHTTTKYIARYTKETEEERVKRINDVDK
ncbi:MAG: site-specific integrase [Nitrospirae bacterium]|nr:site-specific integrase [Nitrospirota bacterium]